MFRLKQILFCCLVLAFIAGGCAPRLIPTPEAPTEQAGLANPASVYCEEKGGKLEIRTDENGGQYGVCIFEDGSECEEWAYFRGECQPGKPVDEPAVEPTTEPTVAPTVEPTAEPTAEPTPALPPRYVNDAFGFSFSPAEEWAIETHEDYLLFTQPGYQLFVGFQYANEDPKPFRTGMPAGDFVDGGTVMLLGQAVPRQVLVAREKKIVVAYNGRIKIGDLILVFYFDAVPTDSVKYEDMDIPPEMMAAADQLISSFALTSGKQPPLELNP